MLVNNLRASRCNNVVIFTDFTRNNRKHESALNYFFEEEIEVNMIQRFNKLAAKWQNETCGLSSITKKITNFNYLKIIAMGKTVVPLILHSLAQQPDHWFVALKVLTDQDPTSPNSSFEEAVEAWLSWGKQEGLID
ncbi:MAG: hypothetical protein F6K47_12460 [Symploca sp. SIO2E6]|nr:hypothetical protein [Symploca sp. SIO2E6]